MDFNISSKPQMYGYMEKFFLKIILTVTAFFAIGLIVLGVLSKNMIGNEIITLHQSLMQQLTRGPEEKIYQLRQVLDQLTNKAEIQNILTENSPSDNRLNSAVQNTILENYQNVSLARIYIYNNQQLCYANDPKVISFESKEKILKDADCINGYYYAGPIEMKEDGLYKSTFIIMVPINDAVTRAEIGQVVMQVSEAALYRSYSKLSDSDRNYFIVNSEGVIISARHKDTIGNIFSPENEHLFKNGPKQSGFVKETGNQAVFYNKISGTNWYFEELVSLSTIYSSIHKLFLIMLLLFLILAFVIVPITVKTIRHALKPIDIIKDSMKQVAGGDFNIRISEKNSGKGELRVIADSFNHMAARLGEQLKEMQEIERKRHLLQLDLLQTQINPHFIYNTLSSIRFYVEMGKNKEAETMLIAFSKVLRKTLSKSETFVTLAEEIETLNDYIDLQKYRYRNRFSINIDIAEDTLNCIVPDFILQPIVENAIFYSLKAHQVCHVEIYSQIKQNQLFISVADDGAGMDAEKIDHLLDKDTHINHIGVRNVHERLQLNYGECYGLKIKSILGEGTVVTFVIPVERGKDNENIDC